MYEFQNSFSSSRTPTISWYRVNSTDDVHYENASSEESHLLMIDYLETGPLKIAVTYSSPACNKTGDVIAINGK